MKTTAEKMAIMLGRPGSFVAFIGYGQPGGIRTMPINVEATRLRKPVVDPQSWVLECYGEWTKYNRIQFSAATMALVVDVAYDAFVGAGGNSQQNDAPIDGARSQSRRPVSTITPEEMAAQKAKMRKPRPRVYTQNITPHGGLLPEIGSAYKKEPLREAMDEINAAWDAADEKREQERKGQSACPDKEDE